jgi:hypothetical protein
MAPSATASLALCHRLLDARDTDATSLPTIGRLLTATDFAICPDYGGTMRQIAIRAALLQTLNHSPVIVMTVPPTSTVIMLGSNAADSNACTGAMLPINRFHQNAVRCSLEIDAIATHSPQSPAARATDPAPRRCRWPV